MTDRALELDDIQGNILAGFNTDIQELIGLTVPQGVDFRHAGQWLAALAPTVTVASEVRANREPMKSAPPDPQMTWLCVGVSQRLLSAIRPEVLIRDDAFNGGMLRRAPSVLGDKTDPKTWQVGGSEGPLDVLLIVAANNEEAVQARAAQLIAGAAGAGLVKTYRETGRRIDDREHFGFRDGVSQPKLIGYDADGTLGPGHFIFGYPKQPGAEPFWPVIDDGKITDNGSLLVFRRLAQNVPAFRKFCDDESARVASLWPGLERTHLAALLVGRWPSGAPVKASQTQDPGGSPPNNTFDFLDDPDARSCPFGAHIRKINPRAGPKDVVEVPRMLRRGIPFGPTFDSAPDQDVRGLAFLAFQSSVRTQFEFLTQRWMNSAQNPGRGNDLLVGRAEGVRTMSIVGPNGQVAVSAPELQWIVPTGGAYLFAPGRSGLAKFAAPPPALGLWKVRQLWAMTTDSIRASLFD
jgi:Dyp-type peroxidase family